MTDPTVDVPGVAELYERRPSEFVAARNELVKRLRADGQADAAKAVAKLRRPTVVAWALNQVARRDVDAVDALLRAGAAVRDAQARAVERGEAASLRDAMRERRALVTTLAAGAAELAGAAHRDEAAATLEAASVDEAVGEALRAGRLAAEVDPASGFELADLTVPDRDERADRADRADRAGEDEVARQRARRELARAEAALKRSEERLQRAEQRLHDADERLADAQERRADAQRVVDDALGAVEAARTERDDARRQAGR